MMLSDGRTIQWVDEARRSVCVDGVELSEVALACAGLHVVRPTRPRPVLRDLEDCGSVDEWEQNVRDYVRGKS